MKPPGILVSTRGRSKKDQRPNNLLTKSLQSLVSRGAIYIWGKTQRWLETPSSFAASSADLDSSMWSIMALSLMPSRFPMRSASSLGSCLLLASAAILLAAPPYTAKPCSAHCRRLSLLELAVEWLSSSLCASDTAGPLTLACFFLWRSMLCFRVNLRQQMSQVKGRSPV